jgi:hypothetical protein
MESIRMNLLCEMLKTFRRTGLFEQVRPKDDPSDDLTQGQTPRRCNGGHRCLAYAGSVLARARQHLHGTIPAYTSESNDSRRSPARVAGPVPPVPAPPPRPFAGFVCVRVCHDVRVCVCVCVHIHDGDGPPRPFAALDRRAPSPRWTAAPLHRVPLRRAPSPRPFAAPLRRAPSPRRRLS